MSNRIAGNVIIIDSGMGNLFALTSSNTPNHYSKYYVNAFAVYQVDTSCSIKLTGINTTNDVYFIYDFPAGAQNSPNLKWFSFGREQRIEDLKAPVITAGTAYIYLV